MLHQIFFDFRPEIFPDFLAGYATVMFWMTLGYGLHMLPPTTERWGQRMVTSLPLVFKAALITLVVMLVMQIKSSEVQPFIYFQF